MNPIATFKMKSGHIFQVELLPSLAPNTVNSFIYLAQSGCYDQYAIQRIVPNSWIDISYSGLGNETAKYFINNEATMQNNHSISFGHMCMGGYSDQDIAGGEIFFPLRDCPDLVGKYPILGNVLNGIEIMRTMEGVETYPVVIEEAPTIEINTPVEPIIIESVTVETFGVNYPLPIRKEPIPCPPRW